MLEPESTKRTRLNTIHFKYNGIECSFVPPDPAHAVDFASNLVQTLRARGWERRAYLNYGLICSLFKTQQPFSSSDHDGVESIQKYLRNGWIGCMVGSIPSANRFGEQRSAGRESDRHLQLKGDGMAFLQSLGYSDVEYEGDASYGGADVRSYDGNISVEVGDTPVTRACHVIGGNPSALISLPYRRDGRAICIFTTMLGRFNGAFMDACRFEETRQKMMAYQLRVESAIPSSTGVSA